MSAAALRKAGGQGGGIPAVCRAGRLRHTLSGIFSQYWGAWSQETCSLPGTHLLRPCHCFLEISWGEYRELVHCLGKRWAVSPAPSFLAQGHYKVRAVTTLNNPGRVTTSSPRVRAHSAVEQSLAQKKVVTAAHGYLCCVLSALADCLI